MIIYKTTNLINGKIYVGQDSKNNFEYLGSGNLIRRSVKKYGKENFKKEILCECKTKEELNEREIYWIKKLKSQNKNIGYNITDGGNQISTVKSVKEKISQTLKGKKNSELSNFKRSKTLKEFYQKHPKRKEEISQRNKKYWRIKENRLKQKKNRENFFQLNSNHKKYLSEKIKKLYQNEELRKKCGNGHRKILQYDRNGNFIKQYNSIKEAAEENNIFAQNISTCCRKKIKQSCGFIWKYKKMN